LFILRRSHEDRSSTATKYCHLFSGSLHFVDLSHGGFQPFWNSRQGVSVGHRSRRMAEELLSGPQVSCGRVDGRSERVAEIVGPDPLQSQKGRPREAVSKTKIRLALMAYTGLSPAFIMRLRPKDVRWDAGTVFVQGRRKGRGTKGRTMPLTSKGLKALRHFDEADCWGEFSTSAVWKSFHLACAWTP
jgi:hypothetical protein